MTLLQAFIILVAAASLYGVGAALLLPPLKKGVYNSLQTRILLAFSAKLVLGVGWLVLVWKGLGWSTFVAAFGMATAYLLALVAVTFNVLKLMKGRQG